LGIVFKENQELTMIDMDNPLIPMSKDFNPSFPYKRDLSEFLPPEGTGWWEELGKHH
jgi:hypothetical protein